MTNTTNNSIDDTANNKDEDIKKSIENIKIIFVMPDKTEIECNANTGDTLLMVAHDNDIPIKASCGGALACSTCHAFFEEEHFNILDVAEEEEEDRLDLAQDLTSTSRLCCQIILNKKLDGIKVYIPKTSLIDSEL